MAFYYYTAEMISKIDPEAIPETFIDHFNDLSEEGREEIKDNYPELYKKMIEMEQSGIYEGDITDDSMMSSDEQKILDKWESINIKEWHKNYVYTDVLVCKIIPDGVRWCKIHKCDLIEKFIKYSRNGELYGHNGFLCPECMTLYVEQSMIGDIIHNLDKRNYAMLIQPLEDTMKEWDYYFMPTKVKEGTVIYIPDVWIDEDMKCPEDGGELISDVYKREYKDRNVQFGACYCKKCRKIQMRSSAAQQLNIDCSRIGIPEFEFQKIKHPQQERQKSNNKYKPDYFIQNGDKSVYNYDDNKYEEVPADTIFVVSYSRVCNFDDHDTSDKLVLIRVDEKKGSYKRYLVLVGFCEDCNKYYIAQVDYEKIYSVGRPHITIYDDTNSNYYIQSGLIFEEEKLHLKNLESSIDKTIASIEKNENYVGKYAVIKGGYDDGNLATEKENSADLREEINSISSHRDNPYGYRVELINKAQTKTYYLGPSEFSIGEFKIDTYGTMIGAEMVNYRNTEVTIDKIKYHVKRRRQFDIIKAVLYGYIEQSDEDVIFREGLTDPFLVKVLNMRKKQHQLVDIMFTIQENQNAIVDVDPEKNIIVQGCAGSGKTVVMLQRLSAIKSRYSDFDFKRVVVLTPSENFNTHINGLADILQIGYIERLSVEGYYKSLLSEYSQDFKVKYAVSDEMNISQVYVDYMYSNDFWQDFLRVYDNYMDEMVTRCEEAVYYSKYILDENTLTSISEKSSHKALLLLNLIDDINRKIKSIVDDTGLSKEKVYDRLLIRNVDDKDRFVAFLDGIEGYSVKTVYNEIYEKAAQEADEKLYKQTGKKFFSGIKGTHRYDLYLQLRFAKKFYGYNVGDNSLICVDEGQDLCLNEYQLIKSINNYKAVFNIYGDTNQLIKSNRGIGNWSILNKCIDSPIQFRLNENFRNTNQITAFCNETFKMNVVQTGVDGRKVREIIRSKLESVLSELDVTDDRVAILLPREIKRKKKYIDLDQLPASIRDVIGDRIGNGRVCVSYVDEVKGVEFDKVFVVVSGMSNNEKYIASTRALSELTIVVDEELEEKIREREEKNEINKKNTVWKIETPKKENEIPDAFVANKINYGKVKTNKQKVIEYEESKVVYTYNCQRCKKNIEMIQRVFNKYKSKGAALPKICPDCRKQLDETVNVGTCKICKNSIMMKRKFYEQLDKNDMRLVYCSDCIKSGKAYDGNRVFMTKQCIICSKKFDITYNDNKFYKKKGWNLPSRCEECRKKKRELL